MGSRADGTVTWSNPDQCQAYVKRLQVAAERVASENRTLRKMHQRLAEVGHDFVGHVLPPTPAPAFKLPFWPSPRHLLADPLRLQPCLLVDD